MTDPITPPPRKNPQVKTRSPSAPPDNRSRAALGLTTAAAEGRFMLQQCVACDALQYPPRDACNKCLCVGLQWQDISPHGTLLADTQVQTSPNIYFRERTPWRTGTVQLDAGPVIICHIHGDCVENGKVSLLNRLDRAGQGVMIAIPQEATPNMQADQQLRELGSDPQHRRVLLTDARAASTPAIVQSLMKAGASHVFIGESESWRPYENHSMLQALDNVSLISLDITDTRSVKKCCAEICGKTDILINNASFVRPGGVIDRGDTTFAKVEMETNYFGLMRLAQAFAPVMSGRTADGVNSATAWVNLLPVHAMASMPEFSGFHASAAAANALHKSLRAQLRSCGIRVMAVYSGPTEDRWYESLPPPKVSHDALANAVVHGLRDGLDHRRF